jgi:RHH-type transcriptional regulator, proline utilization regulon repressor / proline dehydrogenase / delta 1-pyrroline-5-carboxylate dehydrogenase
MPSAHPTTVCGAARELVVGDPSDRTTDVGPVIDAEAFDGIQRHLVRQQSQAKNLLGQPLQAAQGHTDSYKRNDLLAQINKGQAAIQNIPNMIPPQAFEVAQISDLKQKFFGPVLHIVRWTGDPLKVIEQINALGYGLTIGIQTRIDSRAQALAHAAHIGNVYINRKQIGAVVGAQPFGGEGDLACAEVVSHRRTSV